LAGYEGSVSFILLEQNAENGEKIVPTIFGKSFFFAFF
jgi:hypothetical protein